MTFVGLMSGALLLVGLFAWVVLFGALADGGLMMEMAAALYGILGAICVSTFLIIKRLSQLLGKVERIQRRRVECH